MFLLFSALAQSPAVDDLYAWPTDVEGERHLALALTAQELVAGVQYVFSITSPSTQHEVVCSLSSEAEMGCRFEAVLPLCASCAVIAHTPLGTATQANALRLFAGERMNPSPAKRKKAAKKKRKRNTPDPEGQLIEDPIQAIVVEFPVAWLGEDSELTVSAAALRRHWSTLPPPLWASPTGRACEGYRLLLIEPDPWAPTRSVRLDLGSTSILQPLHEPLPWPTEGLRGTRLLLDDDPSQSCALTGSSAEVLSCGVVQVAVHAPPLCDQPYTDELLTKVGRPELPRTPPQVDALDGTLDLLTPVEQSFQPLRLDTSHPCLSTARTFLELERAESTGRKPSTCGGRTPGSEALDVLLTLGINGPERLPPGAPYWGNAPAKDAPKRTDGVVPPPPLSTFPYLAPL